MYQDTSFRVNALFLDEFVRRAQSLDIAPGPGGSRFSDYDASLPALAPAIDLLDIFRPVERIAVVALYPSSQIVAHVDANPDQWRRFHIPLQLNDRCWVFHDGDWQQLVVGRVYQMDPTKVHGAVNWGTEVRLHLLVDTQ